MRLPYVRLVLSALVAAWAASPARGQLHGTLTSGNATFTLIETPGGDSISNGGPQYTSSFQTDSSSANQLYGQWLYYRVDGDGRERPLGDYIKTGGGQLSLTGVLAGSTMTYSFTERDPSGATRFTATWTITLQDGAAPGTATVLHSVTVTNPETATAPLNLSLFHYLDYELGGLGNLNTATGDLNGMTITDGSVQGTYTPITQATAFEAAALFSAPAIDTKLLDGAATDLNGGGLPITSGDDWTGAYQWNRSLAPGESTTIQFEMAVSPVPEPGPVFALVACGLGLVGLVRRHRLTGRAA
jgi:hypothetical protein